MPKLTSLRQRLKGWLSLVLIVIALIGAPSPVWAEPSPLTPARAKYELDHANSAQEAGQRMQQISKDYKQELAKSPTPIPNAAENAKQKTEGLLKLFFKRVEETVHAPTPTGGGEG